MYAELLDMTDGLPGDLDQEWCALAPVPAGKRCLAVVNGSKYDWSEGTLCGSIRVCFMIAR